MSLLIPEDGMSLHYLALSRFLSSVCYRFWHIDLLYVLRDLYLNISSLAIVNGIGFNIFYFQILFLVYRNMTDFYVLTLHSTILLNSFISSR